jgi:hypothetical protein
MHFSLHKTPALSDKNFQLSAYLQGIISRRIPVSPAKSVTTRKSILHGSVTAWHWMCSIADRGATAIKEKRFSGVAQRFPKE